VSATAERLARFRDALTANLARAHGPLPADGAADLAVELARERAGGRAVAVATGDPVLAGLDLPGRLAAAGVEVLLPPLGSRGMPGGELVTPTVAEAGSGGWEAALASAGAGVTGAFAGLAATGSVGVACGPGAPRAVSLVPPAHVCIVRASDVVEDLTEALRDLIRRGPLPSNLVWVGGPSRSADLEMTLTLGVHGPASVDVVVVDDAN